jgi:outer membrane protein assembly factor BamB
VTTFELAQSLFTMRLKPILLLVARLSVSSLASDWPRFRGPNGSGVGQTEKLPIEFGPGTNLQWRIPVLEGSSSPIIASNRVWLTGYSGNRRSILCLNLETGIVLWERSLESVRSERKSAPNDAASSTPVTDGRNVYALFSEIGLVSYAADGQERWRRSLGPLNQPHGMSSSPMLVEDSIIVLADQVSDSSISAFDTRTGELKWKVPRPNLVGGYSTPVLFREQIVVGGPAELVAYAPGDGKRLWSAPKMGVMPVGSPVCDGNRVFVNNGAVPPFESLAKEFKADRNGDGKLTPDEFPDPSFKEAVLAIDRIYGNGDGAVDKAEWDGALHLMQVLNALVAVRVDNGQTKELWRMTKGLPEVASPLLYEGLLYLLRDGGILGVVNPEDGRIFNQERLNDAGGRYFASPVAANNKLYTVNESGVVCVVQAGDDWQQLKTNELREECYATPAIAKNTIVVRTKHTLWAFRERP